MSWEEKFGAKAPPIGMDDDGNLNELKPREKPPMPVIIINTVKRKKAMNWTEEAHRFIYTTLMQRFGSLDTWERKSTPGRGRNHEYQEVTDAIGVAVGTSGEAVRMQIAFALPVAGRTLWSPGHARQAILNIAAALRAGFIKHSDLPYLVAHPGDHYNVVRELAEATVALED